MSSLVKIKQLELDEKPVMGHVYKDSDIKRIEKNGVILKRRYGKFKRNPIRIIYE